MRSITTLMTAAAALAIALPAAAQTTSGASTAATSTPPAAEADDAATSAPTTSAATPSTGASTAATASTPAGSASVTAGLSVKDNTGATIGQVADVKSSGGKQVATIKMGAESFAVDASSLAVADGAATINASQAELKDMIKKAGGGAAKTPAS